MRRVGIFLLFVAPLAAQNHTALRDYGRLPLVFEPNLGQIDPAVKFLARTEGGTLFLTEREMVLARGGSAPVRMRLTGAGKPQALRGLEPTGGISNYFIGNDPARWRTGIPHYSRVEYKSVYAGVDVVYYGNPQKLEYDLVVAPGVDPKAIQVEYDGVESMRVDGNGDLVLRTADGELRQKRPRAYQEKAGGQVEVKVGYRLKAHKRVEFALARYDVGRRLVIDPVLLYSTFLGGGNLDSGLAIALDSSRNAYVTGQTFSTDFPTTNPLQVSNAGGGGDVFVTKINAAGSARVYSTYLGGSSAEQASAIAVDSSGNAYVTGQTMSTNFPTQLPLQAANGGGIDAFVTKINAAGSALVYSTYLGGSGSDGGQGIAVDVSGAYLTGFTSSTNFPTASPLQPSSGGGGLDGFVTKINAAGSALAYSTYLGGSGIDQGQGIAVDSSGNAYVTGQTNSSNFPTANPFQSTNAGGTDVFVTKINSAGSGLLYSTYLGGSAGDLGFGIAVDSSGNAYVTGFTGSPNFPTTPSAMQTSFGGGLDAFVTKLSAAGASVYSTYLGGSGSDEGLAIAVDGSGNAYVTGLTQSTNFPTAGWWLQGSNGGGQDAFVTRINAVGSSTGLSSYLGGSGIDQGNGIAVDGSGNAYVAGSTQSTNFPTTHALQAGYGGSQDAFVVSISGKSSDVGIFRSGFFWLEDVDGNQMWNSPPDRAFAFGGVAGDIPISGDWNGSGTTKVGIYRPLNGLFILDSNGNGVFDAGDAVYNLGVGTQAGDLPVVGDWNGDGRTKVGLFRQGFFWILDYNGNGVFEQGIDKTYAFGGVGGDVPVVGDWTGTGTSKIGLVRLGFYWILDTNGNGSFDGTGPGQDVAFAFGGIAGDVPVVGDWNGDGTSKVGVFREGFFWVLDANGNRQFDGTGPGQDFAFAFGGISGDKPIVGKW